MSEYSLLIMKGLFKSLNILECVRISINNKGLLKSLNIANNEGVVEIFKYA